MSPGPFPSGQTPHPAALVVRDCLFDLLGIVHNERAAADDRFLNRLAAKQQYCRIFCTVDTNLITRPLKQANLGRTDNVRAIQVYRTLEHHEHRSIILGHRKAERLFTREMNIPHMDWGEGPRGSLDTAKLARDDAQTPITVRKVQHRNLAIQNTLVAGWRHLVPCWQVDP